MHREDVLSRFIFVVPDLMGLQQLPYPNRHALSGPEVLLEVSKDLQGAVKGLAVSALDEGQLLQTRGW